MRELVLAALKLSFSCFVCFTPYGLAPIGESFIPDRAVTRRQHAEHAHKVSGLDFQEK